MKDIFVPCPFCGVALQVSTVGRAIKISCCATMSIPKTDVVCDETLGNWNEQTRMFSREGEDRAYIEAARKWNARSRKSFASSTLSPRISSRRG